MLLLCYCFGSFVPTSGRDNTPFTMTADLFTPRLNVEVVSQSAASSFSFPNPTDLSSNDDSITVPPSPTLSNHSSVHFNTSHALRDNKPEALTGFPSVTPLGLIDQPNSKTPQRHHRKGSDANSKEGTEADHSNGLRHLQSNTTRAESSRTKRGNMDSDTATAVTVSGARKKKKHDVEEETPDHMRAELPHDTDVDPTPFAFQPYELPQMLDPKNLELLKSLGGTPGLLRGLGTNPTRGLGKQSLTRTTTVNAGDGRPGDAFQLHDPEPTTYAPAIVLTAPEGVGGNPLEGDGPAFSASLNERRKIYGENVLPHRACKSLLQLMWAALKDKVLV